MDNLITLGSAGLPDGVDEASDLRAGHVYAGQSRNGPDGDQRAWIGRNDLSEHSENPVDESFGATTFGVDNGGDYGDPVTDHGVLMGKNSEGERGYLDRGTESLYNVRRIIIGDMDELISRRAE